MSIKNRAENKVKKVIFKIIKPFLPFIAVILGIILAVCTVVDALFTTEEDMQIAELLSSENYEEQYEEWLKEKEESPSTITSGTGLISSRYVYMANSWIYNNNVKLWYEDTSNNSVLIHYIQEQMSLLQLE